MDSKPKSGCAGVLFAACAGVILPAILLALNAGNVAITQREPNSPSSFFMTNALNLMILSALFATPGALALGWPLSIFLSRRLNKNLVTRAEHFWTGMILGALLAFLNLPAYAAIYVMRHIENPVVLTLRVIALFAITGSVCGLFIAWHLWSEYHPEEPLLRFSLRTLLLAVLFTAAVLAIFAP